LIGNPEYVPTTNDEDLVEKLRSRKWSVVFFAPGACRFSEANRPIPGSNSQTQRWTLEQYRELVRKHQGDQIQIVETLDERETVSLLAEALENAPETTGNNPASS
jgi:ADP-heptose:LPS heptosyltransferase